MVGEMIDKPETKNPVGRPPFYKTAEELQSAIDNYFLTAVIGEYTITGLALSLGFATRKSLLEYEGEEEFVNAIKKAKLRIEQDYEQSLRKNGRSGDIFGLKNFGWRDAIDQNIGGQNGENPLQQDVNLKVEFVNANPVAE